MSALKDGVYFDMPRADYDAIDRVNFSTLKFMHQSPAHYRNAILRQDRDTDARKLGRATHIAVFEPMRYARGVAVWDGDARRGKDWEKFKLQNAGRELLTQNEHDRCMAIQVAVRANPAAQQYVSDGAGELTLLWTIELEPLKTGSGKTLIFCKGRIDFDARTAIADLKSCRDASPAGFGRAVWEYRLHTQASWYRDAYKRLTDQWKPYKLICVESAAPHVTQVYNVPDELLELGRAEYQLWLDRLAWCRATNTWPGYAADGEELDASLPPWAMPRNDDIGGLDIEVEGNAASAD